jgi:hypothetical protein
MGWWDSYKNSSWSLPGLLDMGNHDDPKKAANKYLEQIPGMGHGIYDPYINEGKSAGSLLKGEYGKMLDPTSFMDMIMSKYNESKGAQYEKEKLGKGIGATAAAGGIAGTPEHQREYGEMAGDIMSKDMQQFLENALRVYDGGISGEQDIYNKGFGASGSLADLLGGTLASQGGLGFQAATQKNAERQAFMNAFMKALSSFAGAAA